MAEGRCLKCGSPVTGDFGMVKCDACGEVMFLGLNNENGDDDVTRSQVLPSVHSDDEPTVSKVVEPSEKVMHPVPQAPGTGFTPPPAPWGAPNFPLPPAEEPTPWKEPSEKVDPIQPQEPFESSPEPADSEEPAIEAQAEALPVPDFAQPGEINEDFFATPATAEEGVSKRENSDLRDIADFGNSEISQGKDGFIVYDLTISGIETKDIRIAVRDALTDKKFMWDADNLIRGSRGGVLKLTQLNPVKASLVVRRLKHLPVQVSWEQHAIVEGRSI